MGRMWTVGVASGSSLGSIDLPPLPVATLATPPGGWCVCRQALAGHSERARADRALTLSVLLGLPVVDLRWRRLW